MGCAVHRRVSFINRRGVDERGDAQSDGASGQMTTEDAAAEESSCNKHPTAFSSLAGPWELKRNNNPMTSMPPRSVSYRR